MRLILLSLLTLILVIANLYFGAVSFSASEITSVLLGKATDESLNFIILEGRLPQALTALLSGAGLAASGLMLQTIFRNPLAGPSILGITSGSSLGVALVMLCFGGIVGFGSSELGGNIAIIAGALVGSFLVMGFLIVLAERIRSNLSLLIVGMMTGYLTSSIVTLLSSMTTARSLQGFINWGMGTFSGVTTEQLPLFSGFTLIGLVLAMLMSKPLNLLLLGDNYAMSLGVDVRVVRRMLLLSTGLLAAVITSFCGPISFIGLAMPHVARLIMKTDNHLLLMPATMLCGAILALGVQLLSVCPDGYIIPINALTPIAGVPVVLYIIIKNK